MQPERLPLGKVFDVPFLSLDGTSVEMASLIFVFLMVIGISAVKRRRQLIRRFVQAGSFLVFYYIVYSCLGVFGMIRNGLYGTTLLGSAYSESFYWLALPVVIISVTLLHGTVFCGWICPTGTVQDLAGWIHKRFVSRSERLTRGGLIGLGLIGSVFFLIAHLRIDVSDISGVNWVPMIKLVSWVIGHWYYWLALTLVIMWMLRKKAALAAWLSKDAWPRNPLIAPGRLVHKDKRMDPGRLIGLTLFVAGFLILVIWLGERRQLLMQDSSVHWAAMLILLCYLVLARVIDDLPSRKLRFFSLAAVFFTAVSHLVVTSPLHFAFTTRDDKASAITTLVILVSSIFVLRPWCRYLCPWGALMGLLHPFSRLRIQKASGHCTECGVCNTTCDVAAINKGVIRLDQCQFCYSCVDHCPNGGLRVVNMWDQPQTENTAAPKAEDPA
jgi:polyferredoxin